MVVKTDSSETQRVVTIGVDIGKKTFHAAIIWPEITVAEDLGEFPNNPKGFRRLARKAQKKASKLGIREIQIIIEPTGGYEQPLAEYAHNHCHWYVSMPNPKHVRDWAKGEGRRSKTDKIDARMLAKHGATREKGHQWKPLPQEDALLNEMVKRKEQIETTIQQEKNRMHALEFKNPEAKAVIASMQRVITSLEEELKALDEDIHRLIKQNPDFSRQLKLLKTVPGIGEQNSLYILAFLRSWSITRDSQKSDAKSLGAYVGLDPIHHQSGTTVYIPPHISRQGNAALRARLYMSALGGVRGKILKPFYQKMLSRGKKKKVALVACARKILIWAWGVLQSDTAFDPKRIAALA